MPDTPNSLSGPINPRIDLREQTRDSRLRWKQHPSGFVLALLRGITLAGLLATMLALSSCGFSNRTSPLFNPCDLDQIEPAPATTPAPSVAFEQIGSIKVMHGVTRATRANGRSFLRVEQSVELPPYANQATVFLNGWKANYNDSDHHLAEVGTLLGRIRVTPGKISWNAFGRLSDADGAEAFTWEYRYTIIAWNDTNVRAMVDHNDGEHFCKSHEANGDDNFFIGENFNTPADGVVATTALLSFPSFLKNGGFASGRQVAVLPRGFGFLWTHDDHHLFQLAYNLESVAPFARLQPYHKANSTINPLGNSTAAKAGGEFVSWKTSVIMKDNSRRRDYSFVEFVSGIGGPDVEVIQPEVTVLPRQRIDTNFAGGGPTGGLKSADVVIENLPYTCAVPMLTGWEIGYEPGEGDQHVKELGIFLESMSYERPATSSVGTLRYRISSIVKDNDAFPDNYFRHKVTVLGLKPTGLVVPPAG